MVRIICILIGYVFGLFQTSYILGRLHGIDIRDYGSGNAGTTNMMRTLGTKAGLITFFGDAFKCVFASLAVRLIFGETYKDILPLLTVYTGAGVILGHNYPFYLGFRGGKGIAATGGLLLSIHWSLALLGLAEFMAAFLSTHYVSLGSLVVYVGMMIELVIFGQLGIFGMNQIQRNEMYLVAFLLMLLAFWKHRENIKRLKAGNERKTYLHHRQ